MKRGGSGSYHAPARQLSRIAPKTVSAAVAPLLQKGLEHHRAGQWAQAEALYRQTLAAAPMNPDARHLLGLIAQRFGKHADALQLIGEAIKLCPANAVMRNSHGSVLQDLQRYEEALESFEHAIRLNRDYPEALNNRGNTLRKLNRRAEALESYDEVIRLKPDHVEALNNRGNTLVDLRRYEAALESFGRAIRLKPDHATIHNNLGNAFQGLRQYEHALRSYDQAIQLKPDFAEAYRNRGAALAELKRYAAAVESFARAIAIEPDFAAAYYQRGCVFGKIDQHRAALRDLDQAIQLKPDFADAYNNRGVALVELEMCEEALASFSEAIRLQPAIAEFYKNRAAALLRVDRYQEAVEDCDRAIRLQPDLAGAYGNRGAALIELRQFEAALQSCDQAIRLQPDLVNAYSNRAVALTELKQFEAALESCDIALRLQPDNAELHCNRGGALFELRRTDAALESCGRAILLKPDFADAYYFRGLVLQWLKRYPDALRDFDSVLLLEPDRKLIRGAKIHIKQHCCDWETIASDTADLEQRLLRGERAAHPFDLMGITASGSLQKKAVEVHAQQKYPVSGGLAPIRRRAKRDKIRIGYYSADFRDHALTHLMAQVFEQHDKSRFELLAFSFGRNTGDEMQQRVAAAMNRFLDVRSMSPLQIASLSRELEVDIAVDLMGYTLNNRAEIFAERAAPVQVNYLGYPGTMGARFIDYIIGDETLIPEANRQFYSEKIVYLPDTFQANDSRALVSDKPFSRAAEGLPESGFVYCCFNNSYKISPGTFDVWMRILARVEGSVLWLQENNPWVAGNLRKEAEARGIAAERLVFAGTLPLSEHLARQRLADLFLDTLPFNAGATASAALRAGLPILTCAGEAFVGRMGASLLRAIGLPDLITATYQEYEKLAVELSASGRIQAAKQRLQRNLLTAPLFDVPAFTRGLEAGYAAIYDRYQAGLAPDHIFVSGKTCSPPLLQSIRQ